MGSGHTRHIVGTVVIKDRLCGDSGLTSVVVWRQWSYK